ncbi:MAG: glycoside hydrolase family 25 protein [Bacteroidales bacterium]|nr:glycoside hydrolase family 25 protein [Bacteroidales bacterium]HOY37805.1 GH25 family lysozyme [Bacteroidales bacterium]
MPRRKIRRNKKKNNFLVGVFIFLLLLIAAATVYLVFFSGDNTRVKKERYTGDTSFQSYVMHFKDYTVFGIDVSEYQASIDWKKVASEKSMYFVFIRATAGNSKTDRNFITNWYAAGEQKLIRGAYHYYRPNENSTGQAQRFIETVTLQKGDLPPVLDIEQYSHVQNKNSLKTGLLNWLEIVEKHYQQTPIIYTSPNIYRSMFNGDKRFEKYPVWISSLNVSKEPSHIAAQWKFWQFSHEGKVAGIKGKVDIDLFVGTYNDLVNFTIH